MSLACFACSSSTKHPQSIDTSKMSSSLEKSGDSHSGLGGFQGGRAHAIVRSTELLSCARTALRIAQQQSQKGLLDLPEEIISLNPNSIHLYNVPHSPYSLGECDDDSSTLNPATDLVRESRTLLTLLDSHLDKLNSLVKRRGQTNDPTSEINTLMSEFNSYTKELMEIIQKSLLQAAAKPFLHGLKSSQQRIKHFQNIANTIQHQVETRMRSFKDIMTVRGNAIQEMSQRRRRLLDGGGSGTQTHSTTDNNTSSRTTQSLAQSTPLFTITDAASRNSVGLVPSYQTPHSQLNNIQSNKAMSATDFSSQNKTVVPTQTSNSYYGGYGAYNYGNTSYGGDLSSTGIRRRGLHPTSDVTTSASSYPNNYNTHTTSAYAVEQDEEDRKRNRDSTSFMTSQLQQRKESRQTQSRLETAREAEKSLAELTTMFTKMSSLIQSQGEVLMKVEDDVEAAFVQVNAGADEITKLYNITKGNRGLIIKVFSLLIFFIIIMRFYR